VLRYFATSLLLTKEKVWLLLEGFYRDHILGGGDISRCDLWYKRYMKQDENIKKGRKNKEKRKSEST
jgi:hypothetical protein